MDYLLQLKNSGSEVAAVINKHAAALLVFYCKGFSHRLLRTPLEKRNGLTVKKWIEKTKRLSFDLGIDNNFFPEKNVSITAAKIIDSNPVFRKLFLLFKKIYSKPFM